jgi:hypothetical protein
MSQAAGPSTAALLPAGPARVPESATLAANEALARRRRLGQPVLPLAFGEAGLPVLPALRDALSAAAGLGAYGPVAGLAALREAAAGYWGRRGLPTSPHSPAPPPRPGPRDGGSARSSSRCPTTPRASWPGPAPCARCATSPPITT